MGVRELRFIFRWTVVVPSSVVLVRGAMCLVRAVRGERDRPWGPGHPTARGERLGLRGDGARREV